jgi:sugar-specific transcriptional regulator TrmB
MPISRLKSFGLTEREAQVYLALLENGSLSVRQIADITDINRGSVYDTLKSLQEKGLSTYYHKESRQRFVAEDPDKRKNYIKQKEEAFKKIKQDVISAIPELKSLENKSGARPATKLYDDKAGIRKILEDLLGSLEKSTDREREYYVYSATHASEDINTAYPDFTRDRIRKKIYVKAISLSEGGKSHGLDERKWLGTNDESATFIIVYAGKCAFISRDKSGRPVGVIIENDMIYQTQKNIFLKLWELLE